MNYRDTGYSADVSIHLLVSGLKLRVAQIGPQSMILRDVESVPSSTAAQLVVSVDGEEQIDEIMLHNGVTPPCRVVEYS